MNKDLQITCHPETLGEGSCKIFHCVQNDGVEQVGRTLLELVMTLAVIGVLGMGAIKFYKHTVNKVKAQNTAKMIKTLAFERQNSAINDRTGGRRRVKGPHSDLYLENGIPGNHSKYFWVETTLSDSDFCESLKESNLIQADLIEVDDSLNGNCSEHSKLAFYFKKYPVAGESLTWVDGEGNVQLCPTGSAACNEYGEATACEEGYYLAEGTCEE